MFYKYITIVCRNSFISLTRRLFLVLIQIYQSLNLFPPSCRFYPSCSEYAKIVIERFNPLKAFILILKRILRCHPFNPGGLDYPPI